MKTCRFAFVDVAKNICEVDQELGGGELPLSACPGVGNRPQKKEKKCKFPGGLPGGGRWAWLQLKLNNA